MQIIEEALDRMPLPEMDADAKRRRAELEDVLDQFDVSRIPAMAEFDAQAYDARGNAR